MISRRTYLSTLERRLKSPTLDKIDTLADAMKVHPLTLLILSYLPTKNKKKLDALLKKVEKEINQISSNTE